MARVFISHSNHDAAEAARIFAWLAAHGFERGFLDIDKHQGIPPGAKWERTLYDELARAQAVLLVLTSAWHRSKWCFTEFAIARSLGKPVFPLILSPDGDQYVGDDLQTVRLDGDWDEGLDGLARRLAEVALEGQGGFDFPPGRAPYPGIVAFDAADAAVYFGRTDDVRALIQRLDACRINGAARMVAVLGGSGSGKSSLVRAGVLPRLAKDRLSWIAVPPFRPGQDPFRSLAAALRAAGAAAGAGMTPADLERAAEQLAQRHGAHQATVLLAIDQAEELFTTTPPEVAAAFWSLLSAALAPGLPFMAVLTLRTDQLERLQATEALTRRFEEFSLKPFSIARLGEIVRGPAQVASLHVADELVERLREDARTADALPLVAFAMRRLYDAGNGLTLAAYEAMRDAPAGLSPLEVAVRAAADAVLARMGLDEPALAALRRAFVPNMVAVAPGGGFVRRPAAWTSIPLPARPVLEVLAGPEARLVVISHTDGGTRVEVAHEALFRVWPLLSVWLADEQDLLLGLERVRTALADWQALSPAQREAGLLSGVLLDRAAAWLADSPEVLTADEHAFVARSMAALAARREREEAQRRAVDEAEKRRLEAERDGAQRVRQRTLAAACLLGIAALGAAGAAGWAMNRQAEAEARRRDLSEVLARVGDVLADESVPTLLGFTPIERRLSRLILPEQQRAIADREGLVPPAEMSRALLQVGRSLGRTGETEQSAAALEGAFGIARTEIERLQPGTTVPSGVAETLFHIVEAHCWYLLNRGKREEAEKEVGFAATILARIDLDVAGAELLDAASRIGNVRARMVADTDPAERVKYLRLAVDLVTRALQQHPGNTRRQRALSIYNRNLAQALDAQRREDEARVVVRAGCAIADDILAQHPLDPSLQSAAVECVFDRVSRLASLDEFDEVRGSLLEHLRRLDEMLLTEPSDADLRLLHARINARLADDYREGSKPERAARVRQAAEDLILLIRDRATLPTDIWAVEKLYGDTLARMEGSDEDKLSYFRRINDSIQQSLTVYPDVQPYIMIGGDSALKVGEILRRTQGTRQEARAFLDASVDLYRRSSLFKEPGPFSEAYESVCRPLAQRISLSADEGKVELARQDLAELVATCQPFLDRFPFDFYLRQHFTIGNRQVGALLFDDRRYADAVPYLEYASHWGQGSSTTLLARIVREGLGGGTPNVARARTLTELSWTQSMRRFRLPAQFGNITLPFDFHVVQWPDDYPYMGIDDQVEWLKQARGGKVRAETVERFREVHRAARARGMSFPGLAGLLVRE